MYAMSGLCRYAIHGDSSDGAVEETPGLMWAKDRKQRGPLPGQEVGQHIICCNAQATLSGEQAHSSDLIDLRYHCTHGQPRAIGKEPCRPKCPCKQRVLVCFALTCSTAQHVT